ncbi:hypothetical protein VHEMI09603 [[Torrubiella] hemipterigena]|uniref:protein-tyrosine-phosphatase n=1 Tax=[Torrubiella] hemipterigena TaxID=1531966 RepID=A0A0A1TRS4_9HYPO|nr:hypothetical protein VHEMI09603 [[Torrubiella] hemipterigena]
MTAQTARTPGPQSPYHISMPHTIVNLSSTPTTSPQGPFSVGQNYPPRVSSPNRVPNARAPSPNYFGLVIDGANESQDSTLPVNHNWSPASSSIKSFTAALPKPISLDGRPELEAFRRQADRNRGGGPAALPTVANMQPSSSVAPVRPRPTRWHTHHHDRSAPQASPTSQTSSFQLALNKTRALLKAEQEQTGEQMAANIAPPPISKSTKRNSDSLLIPGQLTALAPMGSPLPIDEEAPPAVPPVTNTPDPRLTLMERRLAMPLSLSSAAARATTLPPKLDHNQINMLNTDEFKLLLDSIDSDKLLLLDIRSAQNYSESRITGALNLCIPTTLLKRATFNIEKLQQTFQGNKASGKFSRWQEMEWIIVYDSRANDSRDAVTAQNMVKKFTSAGFSGNTAILRGGFTLFRDSFPNYVDCESTTSQAQQSASTSNGIGNGGLAPVIGGVQLPSGKNDHNPFFSNIRQNMDLADGVGQYEATRPEGLLSTSLPAWLQRATSPENHGKEMAQKFLKIELEEQSRMRGAYAAFNPQHDKSGTKVQLCGVEKGVKNRYKDILPFEHARVRLEGRSGSTCDYINASHLRASGSNKKYIATQGPLPATFEDFWSVVWEQDVRVIVMLTAMSEGGQLKCHPYWESKEFGPLRLRLLSERKASLDMDRQRSDSHGAPETQTGSEQKRRRANTTTTFETRSQAAAATDSNYVIVRKFALSHTAHPFAPIREITHLYFPGWPDFGTPAQPSHLLALVELANVMQRAALPVETNAIVEAHKSNGESLPSAWFEEPDNDANSRPMLVHCSAGCGRTGSFCTVDTVIDMMKRQKHAEYAASRATDCEGDINMDAGADGNSTSTATAGESYFMQSAQSLDSVVKLQSQQQGSNLDLSWIDDGDADLIQRTVHDFREQRLSMVQSLRQYVLCYESMLEWIHRSEERHRALPATRTRKRSGSSSQ